MLNKVNRLTKKKEIDAVYNQGKSFYSKILGVKILENNIGQKRFVIIVSTKVSKLATGRNRLKRRIRAAIKQNLDRILGGRDYMIIVRPGQFITNGDEIPDALLYCLKKLGCIKIVK